MLSDIMDRARGLVSQVDFGALPAEGIDPTSFDPRVWMAIGGLTLLFFGRRLYALALGVAGFAFGWSLAPAVDIGPPSAQLGAGLLLGVLSAMLALFVQRMILSVAGFILGVSVAWWAVSVGGLHLGGLEFLVVLFSGIVSAFLLQALFGAMLVVLTSLVGGSLLAQAAGLSGGLALLAAGGASFFGIVAQTRSRNQEARRERKRERREKKLDRKIAKKRRQLERLGET